MPHYPEIPKEETIYSTVLDRQGLVVHPTQVPNLSIVPSHILLSNTDIELTTAKDHREARLKAKLDRIKGDYDYVFIDNPPALGWLTLNAFTASDQALVVVAPGYSESWPACSSSRRRSRRCGSFSLQLCGCWATCSR